MGAGASVDCVSKMPAAKVERFKSKLLNLETLNDLNKTRLLEQMAYELKKVEQPPLAESDKAAIKIQTLQRKISSRNIHDAGDMSGHTMEEIFDSFCKTYRQVYMTNTIWCKFCKDAKLVDKDFTKADIDMIWSKLTGKTKRVGFGGFNKLLAGVAEKKTLTIHEIEQHIFHNATISNSGTKGASRFYDDKSTFTGAARAHPDSNTVHMGVQN